MVRLGIIADDLTGANDTGVQFGKVGLHTLVIWEVERIENASKTAEVIVVNTESRGICREEAYQKIFRVSHALKNAGTMLFYKKIDSTLRGNLGAELDAVLDALGMSRVLVAPAYPKNRRVTVGGHQLIENIPLEHTEMAQDPITPVKTSHIPTLIREQSKRSVGHISLTDVMKGIDVVKTRILQEYEKGIEILVLDATVDEDLRVIASAAASLEKTPLLCGSAGLAEEIPSAFGFLKEQGGVLILVGTLSTVTARQIDRLAAASGVMVVDIKIPELFKEDKQKCREVNRVCNLALSHLNTGGVVVIRSSESSQTEKMTEKHKYSDHRDDQSSIILSTFGEIARNLINRGLIGLVLTGGDTAMSVMSALGVTGIQIIEEVEAGIPVVTLVGGQSDGLRVVTKAGAFGNDLALLRIVQYLRWGQ